MKFRILNESGDIIAPTDAGPANERLKSLVREAKYYLSPDRTEVFSYIPGKTSLLRGQSRTENLYFYYAPSNSTDLIAEFCQILESLDKGEPVSEQTGTGAAKQESSDTGSIPSEIYEHEWQIRRKKPNGDLSWPWQINSAEPELMNDSFLQREVFDALFKENQELRLGMRTEETAASIIKYIGVKKYETSVGIPKNNSLSEAKVVLTTDSNQDLKPTNDATNQILQSRFNEHLENYASNQIEKIETELAQLEDIIEDDERKYKEFRKLLNYINTETRPKFATSKTNEIIETLDKALSSQDVPSETTNEIERKVSKLINSKLDTIQERIQDDDIHDLKSAIDRLDQVQFEDGFSRLQAMVKIDSMLQTDSSDEVAAIGRTSQFEPIKEFSKLYKEVLEYDSYFDSMIEDITNEIESHLDPKIRAEQNRVKRTIINKAIGYISQISDSRKHNKDTKYEIFDGLYESVVRASNSGASPNGSWDYDEAQDLSRLISRVVNAESLTQNKIQSILQEIGGKLNESKESIRQNKKQELKREVNNISGRITGPGLSIEASLHRIEERESVLSAYPENYRSAKTNASGDISPIDDIIETPCLTKDEQDKLLNNVREQLDIIKKNLSEEVRNQKMEELQQRIIEIDNKISDKFPDVKEEEFELAKKVINNPGMEDLDSDGSDPRTRELHTVVKSIYSNGNLTPSDREAIFESAKSDIDKRLDQLQDVVKSDPRSSHTGETPPHEAEREKTISKVRNILDGHSVITGVSVGIVVGLLIGATSVMFITGAVPGMPGADVNDGSDLTIIAPDHGEGVASNELVVRGGTSAPAVNISAEHISSGDTYTQEVDAEQKSYSAALAPATAGRYLITVRPVSSERSDTVERVITYFGSANPAVNINQPSMDQGTNNNVVTVNGESTFSSVDVALYSNDGTIIDRNTTTVQDSTFETEVTGGQDGVYILVATPSGVNTDQYRDIRVIRVGQEQQTTG